MSSLSDRLRDKRELVVTLTNGVRVANFSSPHDFTFIDGTVLPKRSPFTAKILEVTFLEDVVKSDQRMVEGVLIKTVSLDFQLSMTIDQEIREWGILHREFDVDVVICPLPMKVLTVYPS